MTSGQQKSEVYFGSAESIKNSQLGETEVRLTRFNPITMEDPESIKQSPKSSRTTGSLDDGIGSLSAVDLLHSSPVIGNNDVGQVVNNRWPWFGRITKQQTIDGTGGRDNSHQQIAKVGLAQTGRESFRVVWRRLSFEVKLSSYDRLLNKTVRRARNYWSASKATEKRHHLEVDAEMADSLDSLSGSEKRVIFENLNGFVNSGEISAILGPSGAGKTSLLNAICGKTDNYRGSIQLEGGGKRRMRLSIIPQKDYLNGYLTVRENLLYSSKLLNTGKNFDHEANILRVVKMLNLINCFESSVAKISGGEYKRVSIAQELLRQPDILILDEPTSGLDSLNCKKLIKSLVQLIEASQRGAINPIAIVMTIHQPDVELFQMFDRVYCMARGGRVIFDDHPRDAMRILRERSGIPEDRLLPAGGIVNPANLLIEIASEDLYGKGPVERLARFQRFQFEQQNQVADSETIHSKKAPGSVATVKLEQPQLRTGNLLISAASKHHQPDDGANESVTKQSSRSSSLLSFDIPLTDSKTASNNSGFELNQIVSSDGNRLKQDRLIRDKRLTMKKDHSGKFWHHTHLLASRAFVSTLRDPLMTVSSMLFHMFIPFVMWTVYNPQIGKVKACPVIQRDMDMVSLASNNTLEMVLDQHEQLMSALECSTMFFLTNYSFSMCALTVAALAFPLNMHILLKEVRNGWYSLPSFVVAKTIASFPFEVLFPVISIVMIYLMLGMPSSHLEWRMWAIALVMAFVSIISNTQGLIFGALCMDSVQSAIFLASASSLPLTLLSGFTARIKGMPIVLQRLSWFSVYRYSSDAINMIRFGFNMCPCDNSTNEYLQHKNATFVDVPSNMKPLFTYYLTTYSDEPSNTTSIPLENESSTLLSASDNFNSTSLSVVNETVAKYVHEYVELIPGVSRELSLNSTARSEIIKRIEANEVDLFERMANLMARSFTYGREVDNCRTVRSELLMSAGAPDDDFLPFLFLGMFALLVAAKLILFIIVKFKIGKRV